MKLEEHIEGCPEDPVLGYFAACPACAHRRAELVVTLATFAQSRRPSPAPAGGALRSRILRSVDHLERLAPFAPRLAELVDVSAAEARRALHVFAQPEQMRPAGHPGFRAASMARGLNCRAVSAVLAWFEPSTSLPPHTHRGEERIVVFEGAFTTDAGQILRAGEELVSPEGSTHSTRILDEGPCACLILTSAGVEPS